MKKIKVLLWGIVFFEIMVVHLGCFSVPHLVGKKKDIQSQEMIKPDCRGTVLIGSRKSEFKDAVIAYILKQFKDDSLCFKIEGLDNIENEDSDKYTVIVLMNRCMSWGLDYSVTDFLKKNNKHPHIIVLTTAANENWEPKWKKVAFDGITAASESSKVEQTAHEIVKKIKAASKGS